MSTKNLYHTTQLGLGKKITEEGWEVTRYGTNIYGRGIYFWEHIEDAHSYGKQRFSNKYDIIEEKVPFKNNYIDFDYNKFNGLEDEVSKILLRRGIDIIIIPNFMIESTTHSIAKGKAYVWLVNIDESFRKILI